MDDELPDDAAPPAWMAPYEGLDLAAILVRAADENRAVRVLGPDDLVTLDFRPERLNVVVDDARDLVRLWAG